MLRRVSNLNHLVVGMKQDPNCLCKIKRDTDDKRERSQSCMDQSSYDVTHGN